MPSEKLENLERQIERLKRHLLPEQFEPTGMYEDQENVTIKALSFRVLVHAEIEAYFEERAIGIAKSAWEAWKANRKVSVTALCLLGFSGQDMKIPPKTFQAPNENQNKTWGELLDIEHRLSRAVQNYIKTALHENHGIREHNILSLLLPIGFDHAKLDAVAITSLNEFGKSRGEAAHQSFARVKQAVNPEDEYKTVRQLLSNLQLIDAEFDQLSC